MLELCDQPRRRCRRRRGSLLLGIGPELVSGPPYLPPSLPPPRFCPYSASRACPWPDAAYSRPSGGMESWSGPTDASAPGASNGRLRTAMQSGRAGRHGEPN